MKRNAPRIILALLNSTNQAISKIRLMKLLFILSKTSEIITFNAYSFFPYKYGPYSFCANNDIHYLMEKKLVKNTSDDIYNPSIFINDAECDLIESEILKLPRIIKNTINRIVDNHIDKNDKQLIDYVYEKYPKYTIASILLSSKSIKNYTVPKVFTIGYEGASIDLFLNTLMHNKIARLIDVRKNALSRKFGFSKKRLKEFCEKIDVEYIHIPALGIDSVKRKFLTDFDSYQKLLDLYETEILATKKADVQNLANIMTIKPSVLMCFEADPKICHRSRLAAKISKLIEVPIINFEVVNV